MPKILLLEPLINGSLFSLEAFSKLLSHTNEGGGKQMAGTDDDREQSISTSSEDGKHSSKATRNS
jgi:hypothetical protein